MGAQKKVRGKRFGTSTRVVLISSGIALISLAVYLGFVHTVALLWLILAWTLTLCGVVLIAFGWRAQLDPAAPKLDFLDTVNQSPGDLWQPTQQAWSWRDETDANTDPLAQPTSPLAKERIQYILLEDNAAEEAAASTKAAPAEVASHVRQPRSWDTHVWQEIEWRRLVTVVTGLFFQVGFQPQRFTAVGLTGADVWLQSGNGQLLLRCVASRAGVMLTDVEAFEHAMKTHGAPHGTMATGGEFSDEARAYAVARKIHTLDGNQLIGLIQSRTREQQDSLLQAAYAGAYWRPTCARCGIKLVERIRPEDRHPYWGCRNAPRCTVALPMDTERMALNSWARTEPAPLHGFDFAAAN